MVTSIQVPPFSDYQIVSDGCVTFGANYAVCWLVVGFGVLAAAAVEDPVDDVEDGEDDGKALARELVDAPGVVLAVVWRRGGRRQRGRQRAGHHRLRLLGAGGRRRRRRLMVHPVMRRRLRGGRDARARRGDQRLIDARYHRHAVHSSAGEHGRVADRRVRAAVTSPL